MAEKIDRDDWLEQQIQNRRIQIQVLQAEIAELNEELNIRNEIKSCKKEIEKIEAKIKELEGEFGPYDWASEREEARWDKNWRAMRIAEEHLREEKYLQEQINEKREEIEKIKQKITALEEKLTEYYKKILVGEEEKPTTRKKK